MPARNRDDYDDGEEDVVDSNVNDEATLEFERRPSIMRITTARAQESEEEKAMTESERVVHRRGCFKWLPSSGGNDMYVGSWWFVAGSIITLLIPAFPLISIYLTPTKRFWPTAEAYIIPLDDHAAVYALLVGCGFFFILGSLFLVSIFATDEVVASWFYFFGTIPTVPLCAIYVIYFPGQRYYQIALIFCIAASVVMLLFTYAVYPSITPHKLAEVTCLQGGLMLSFLSRSSVTALVPRQLVSPLVHRCCCNPQHSLHKHVQNDWLIICWLVVLGSVFATVASCAALVYYASFHNRRGIFDYSTGAFDCLLFAVGAAYYVAGSYPTKTGKAAESDVEMNNPVGIPGGVAAPKKRNSADNTNMQKVRQNNKENDDDEHWKERSYDAGEEEDGKKKGYPLVKGVLLGNDVPGSRDNETTTTARSGAGYSAASKNDHKNDSKNDRSDRKSDSKYKKNVTRDEDSDEEEEAGRSFNSDRSRTSKTSNISQDQEARNNHVNPFKSVKSALEYGYVDHSMGQGQTHGQKHEQYHTQPSPQPQEQRQQAHVKSYNRDSDETSLITAGKKDNNDPNKSEAKSKPHNPFQAHL